MPDITYVVKVQHEDEFINDQILLITKDLKKAHEYRRAKQIAEDINYDCSCHKLTIHKPTVYIVAYDSEEAFNIDRYFVLELSKLHHSDYIDFQIIEKVEPINSNLLGIVFEDPLGEITIRIKLDLSNLTEIKKDIKNIKQYYKNLYIEIYNLILQGSNLSDAQKYLKEMLLKNG